MIADLPGLIEGAHEGAGLGDRFLGHTERCRVLLHLIDGTAEDAGEAYRTVRAELEAYGHGLTDKPEIVAISKSDALTPEAIKEQSAKLKKACKKTPLVLSSQSRQGVPEALRALWKIINAAREEADAASARRDGLAAARVEHGSTRNHYCRHERRHSIVERGCRRVVRLSGRKMRSARNLILSCRRNFAARTGRASVMR